VFGGLNRLLLSAAVAGAVLVAPSAALACNGGPSAVNVYKECVPTGGGGKPTGQSSTGPASAPVSSGTTKALNRTGAKDRRVLSSLLKGYGPRQLPSSQSESASAPSAIGSAFDLGSGPTMLLVLLAGTAVLLLVATGVRGVRHRRR
jgi:hypothetical protein